MNLQQQLKLRYSFANQNMTLEEQEIFCRLMKKSTPYPVKWKDKAMHRGCGHKFWGNWDKKEFLQDG